MRALLNNYRRYLTNYESLLAIYERAIEVSGARGRRSRTAAEAATSGRVFSA